MRQTPAIIAFIILLTLACALPPQLGPTATPTPPRFNLAPISASGGRGALKTYRTHLTLNFTGQRSGQPASGQLETLTEVAPAELHHLLKMEGRLPQMPLPSGVSEFYRFNDRVYLKKAGATLWSQFADAQAAPDQFGFFDLERLIILPRAVSTPPLTDTLNGQAALRYRFSQADLSSPDLIFDQAQGEVWLTGGYVARYVISASIRVALPDPKVHLFDQGQFTLRYTLTDPNAALTLAPPTDLPTNNPLHNLPRLPDAQAVAVFPALVEYTSAFTVPLAAQFYQDQLAAQGWTADSVSVFTEKARLTFAKEGQLLTIIAILADDKPTVKVVLELAPAANQ
jgi:hypothetical protein